MYLRRIIKYILLFIASLLAFILLYFLSAFFLSRISVGEENSANTEYEIYISSNGVHTDIAVPLKTKVVDWTQYVKFEHTISKDTTANFVSFGWGDKGFYLETPTWADLKFSVAFNAAFGLSHSAIHATFYEKMKENDSCFKIYVSKEQYLKLSDYIKNSFKYDKQGNTIHIETDANYGNNDAFYEAIGSYSLFHTCNTWTNNGLKESGLKACFWTPFESGIFYQYQTE